MGIFGKWLEAKDPTALRRLREAGDNDTGDTTAATPTGSTASPGADGGDEDPVDPKTGVKLSAKLENYLNKLIMAMDNQKLSKKKQVEVFSRVMEALQGGGMTKATATAATRGSFTS